MRQKTGLRSGLWIFREAESILAESIWWDPSGVLQWCDIGTGVIHSSAVDDPADGSADELLELAPPVAAFQPAGDGYVVANHNTVFVLDRDGTNRRTLAVVEHASETIRFNEGKCDPFGQFVVGSMEVIGSKSDAAIYAIGEDGNCHTLVGGIGVWNGINDVGRVVHWTAGGQFHLEFDVPAGHVTVVAFGGVNYSTLFIATAREKLTEHQLEDKPFTGSIFAIDTGTSGFPARGFGAPRKGNA
ncbi:MAG TPA: SMP-30/gluconolactonase/LRE family protein [Galbitalea sp.]|nr:SMP-30/gluconolactonase/LRE family protein [Galbitalea sp.]